MLVYYGRLTFLSKYFLKPQELTFLSKCCLKPQQHALRIQYKGRHDNVSLVPLPFPKSLPSVKIPFDLPLSLSLSISLFMPLPSPSPFASLYLSLYPCSNPPPIFQPNPSHNPHSFVPIQFLHISTIEMLSPVLSLFPVVNSSHSLHLSPGTTSISFLGI